MERTWARRRSHHSQFEAGDVGQAGDVPGRVEDELDRHRLDTVERGDGVVEVKATSGDNHLGGDDWDQRIVDWLVSQFKDYLIEHGYLEPLEDFDYKGQKVLASRLGALPESVRDGVQYTAMGWEVYPQGMYDLLIRDGLLIDGTGASRRRADIGAADPRDCKVTQEVTRLGAK